MFCERPQISMNNEICGTKVGSCSHKIRSPQQLTL